MWAAEPLQSLAVSKLAVISRQFGTRFSGSKPYRESDPQVDALITELKRQLTREDNAASTSIVGDEHCRPTGRSQADLEDLAELIAARVCAYIEKGTRTSRRKAQTGQTYE